MLSSVPLDALGFGSVKGVANLGAQVETSQPEGFSAGDTITDGKANLTSWPSVSTRSLVSRGLGK